MRYEYYMTIIEKNSNAVIMNFLKLFIEFITNIIFNRVMLVTLAKHDFRSKYFGSYLGLVWAFVNPIVTISIFWFVFEVGFKAKPIDDYPFILWLMAGMIPWFYFAEGLGGATNAILDNTYLVKKVVFRVSILPLVKLLSALGLHLFFICFFCLLYLLRTVLHPGCTAYRFFLLSVLHACTFVRFVLAHICIGCVYERYWLFSEYGAAVRFLAYTNLLVYQYDSQKVSCIYQA